MSRLVYLPHLDKQVKLGRNKPVARHPRLRLENYLKLGMPTRPTSGGYSAAARKSLARMYMNDQLGDCVIAWILHLMGVLSANAGTGELQFTDQQAVDLYSRIGGYVPGNPATDQGCNEQDALNYIIQHGTPDGSKILGAITIDPQNPEAYKTALWLFENLGFGAALPDAWLNNPRPGFVWDAATPDPNNGHAFLGTDWDTSSITIATWGMLGRITDRAIARDVDELHVVLTPAMLLKGMQKAPNGLAWNELIDDFDALGGNVPPLPVPTPDPGPPPLPPMPVPTALYTSMTLTDTRGNVSAFNLSAQ